MACKGCEMTFTVEGSIFVRPGAAVSGITVTPPLGPVSGIEGDHTVPTINVTVLRPPFANVGPSGCQWIIYNSQVEDNPVMFDELHIATKNGKCVPNEAGHCEQEAPCLIGMISFTTLDSMGRTADIYYRINGGAPQIMNETDPTNMDDAGHVLPDTPDDLQVYCYPQANVQCGGADVVIELAWAPPVFPMPHDFTPKWNEGLKITYKCSKCEDGTGDDQC